MEQADAVEGDNGNLFLAGCMEAGRFFIIMARLYRLTTFRPLFAIPAKADNAIHRATVAL